MKWSMATRITAIICGTLAFLGIIGASVWTGSFDALDLVNSVGALLIGMGIAAGPSKRGGGPGVFPFLLFVGFLSTGCSGAQGGRTIDACDIQNNVVNALGAGITAVGTMDGTEGMEWQNALKYAGGVAELGRAATKGCELHRDSAGWQHWVALALETTMALIARFGAADEFALHGRPPIELNRALLLLGAESALPLEQEY